MADTKRIFDILNKLASRVLPASLGGTGVTTLAELRELLLADVFGSESFATTVTKGSAYTSVTGGVYRIGNTLRVNISATRSAASGTGNITNETVCTIKFVHNGKLSDLFNVGFTAASTGPLAQLSTQNINFLDDNAVSFDVTLNAVYTAVTSFNAYWVMACELDLSKF